MSVKIGGYSDKLVKRFNVEKDRLASILPDSVKIEHVGSSAVGIGGKNIVDILVGVSDAEEMVAVRDILIKNGYFERNDSHEDRIFLATRSTGETKEGDFHIHICPVYENSYKNFIILRDFLRKNPEKAEEYFKKKHEFAELAGFDRKKYKALKSVYVTELLKEAIADADVKPKKNKSKKRFILLSLLLVFAMTGCIAVVILLSFAHIDYVLADDPTYEVKTENTIASLFSEVKSGTIEDADTKLDTSTIGQKSQKVTIKSKLGTMETIELAYNVDDTIAPVISGDNELLFSTDEENDILSHYGAEDNSGQHVELSVIGEYDLKKGGDYKIGIIAKDESGNEGTKEVLLKVTEPPKLTTVGTTSSGAMYYVEVNRQQNVVIVYSKDHNGNYSNIAKVFVASTGAPDSQTPLGTYTVSDRYDTLLLVGDVWGHYAVRINGPYFFHSVPYFTKGEPWDNLEYLEYNKLGNGASAGCVRLSAADAKWVYDNISYGTTVKIYDSPTLPDGVVKPLAAKIDENDQNRGWDPTDPDPRNPWQK